MKFIFAILIVFIGTVDIAQSQTCQCTGCAQETLIPGQSIQYTRSCQLGQRVRVNRISVAAFGPSQYTVRVKNTATATTYYSQVSATTPTNCFSRNNYLLNQNTAYVEISCQSAGVSGIAAPICQLNEIVITSCVNQFIRPGDMETAATERVVSQPVEAAAI
jgi:hypothetical protein